MPTLFLLLVGLAAYNLFAGGFAAAADYLFSADFSKVGPATLLAAIGQAFFSVGVAMAGMLLAQTWDMHGSALPYVAMVHVPEARAYSPRGARARTHPFHAWSAQPAIPCAI